MYFKYKLSILKAIAVAASGCVTKSMLRIEKDDVLAAKTLKIVPTRFSAAASKVDSGHNQTFWIRCIS